MKLVALIGTCLLAATLSGCATQGVATREPDLRAELLTEETLDCFPAGLKNDHGEPVYCEASAVSVWGQALVIASDKPVPGRSPFFVVKLDHDRVTAALPRPLMASPLREAIKVEDMSRTPDGSQVLAITGFNRYDPKQPSLDPYNTLMVWPTERPDQVRVIAPVIREGFTSSSGLRQMFVRHLQQPYFKLEGLMVLPGQRLVFGIRETGRNYQQFDYKVLLVETHYRISPTGEWQLDPELRTVLDFSPPAHASHPAVGLSSLAYDARSGRIYVTTSHEDQGQLGAYLWHTDLAALDAGQPLKPIRGIDGKPYHFDNKAEGIAILDDQRLFIIHDDDQVLGGKHQRQPHQAVYSILKISP